MDDFFKGLLWLLRLYIPPKDGNPVRMWRYHVALSCGSFALWLFSACLVLWLLGRLPPFVPQVAWADDVKAIKISMSRTDDRLKDIELLALGNNIVTQEKAVCEAQAAGNQSDLDTANGELTRLAAIYYGMTNRPLVNPSCSTILVDSHH